MVRKLVIALSVFLLSQAVCAQTKLKKVYDSKINPLEQIDTL